MGDVSSEHQELLQFLYSAPAGLVHANLAGDISLINSAAARWLMPLSPDARLENLFRLLAGPAPGLQAAVNTKGRQTGVIVDHLRFEIPVARRREAGPEFVAMTLTKLDGDRLVAVFNDVTQQVRDELALSDSAAHYSAVLSVLSEGIVVHEPGGAMLMCNAAAKRIVGIEMPPVGAESRSAWPLLWRNGTPVQFVDTPTGVVLAGGRAPDPVPMFSIDERGDRRWFDVSAQPVIRPGSSTLLAVVTSFTDVTQRQVLLEALQQHQEHLEDLVSQRTRELESVNETLAEQQKLLRTIADSVPGMIGYWDADLRCRFANQAHLEWFGKTPEQMLGMELRTLMGDELFALNRPHIEAALSGQVQHFQRSLRKPDGTTGHTLASYIPDVVCGRVRGFNVVVSDVTELKQAEFRLGRLNEQLARRALQADEATRAKSAFLANMSHEIRTPMNAIIGLNHLLRRDATDGLQLDRLLKVDRAAQHLLQVINDILDLSKIEAGKMSLEHREFSLDEVLEQATGMVRARAAAKGLELIVDSIDLPERLIGDPTRLSQVLINLLANAVTFTSSGWVRVRAMLTHRGPNGLMARFEVQDTGPGIPQDQQDQLFDFFEQGDNSTTRRHGGTGLGLALTRRFAALMGGDSGVTSTVGSGSTFWFTVNFQSPLDGNTPGPRHDLKGFRALLVDDLDEARDAVGGRLRLLGMTVESRPDAASALALLHATLEGERPFDVLIVDWQMPGMDGPAFVHAARGVMADRMPASILLSTHEDQAMWSGPREDGVRSVLLKPVTASALANCMNVTLLGPGEPRPIRSTEDTEALLRRRHAGQRVLLAEDNPVNQEVAAELLKAAGLVVEIAGDGRQAVEMAHAHAYALVLMDVHMPVLDGMAATREIRRQVGSGLPIVAMTANAFGEDQAACLEAGMNDHLPKPVDPASLYRALLRWLPEAGSDGTDAARAVHGGETASGGEQAAAPSERLALMAGFDVARALASAGGDQARMVRILRSFVAKYRGGDPVLRAAIARGDRQAIQHAAHSIRGACATVGAVAAAHAAEVLEASAAASELQLLQANAQQLVSQLHGMSEALARELGGFAVLSSSEP